MKEARDLKEEIRLLRTYTYAKLKQLENCLDTLIQFARDDLKRLDELSQKTGLGGKGASYLKN